MYANEEREGTSEQWEPIFMKHPRTWALLEVCSNVFTEDGAKMNRWLGLQNIAKHVDYGDIYYSDVRGFIDSALFCKYPKLQGVYRLRFDL